MRDGCDAPADQRSLPGTLRREPSTPIHVLDTVGPCQRGRGAAAPTSCALLRLIQEHADGILVVTDSGRVLFVNPAAEELFGRTRDELLNHEFGYPLVEEDRSELELVRPDGDERVVEMRITRSSWECEPCYIVCLRDISERKRIEKQLRHAQKMEALGRLAGGISHDFNNMLTSILCEASVLLESCDVSDARYRAVRQIRDTATRAAELTSQLLTFSRQRVARRHVVDACEVARDVDSMLRRLIGEHIRLETRCPPVPLRVELERGTLQQVILNLAVNARDAMPHGGVLTIELARTRLNAERGGSEAAAARAGQDHVAIVVRDTGVGIEPNVQARLFEPFFTTKPDNEGTGLGLSVVYGIVEQAKGRIVVLSEPGHGSTFEVFLPIADAVEESAARRDVSVSQTAQAPVNPPRAARLLLAEDEAAVREIVAEILVDAGYDVTCAADGKDALRLLEESGGAVDLLITDVAMPVVSGPELAQRVTERCPDCSILFLSGYPKSESIHRHVDWDRVAFLGKPFTRDDLLAAVRTQLAGRADRPEPPRQDGRQTALMRMA